MLLGDLVKRKHYGYNENEHFDALSSRNKLKYPITKFLVCGNIDESNLDEQIKLHAIDYRYKSVQTLYLICVSFQTVDDYEAFDVPFDACYEIDSKSVPFLV